MFTAEKNVKKSVQEYWFFREISFPERADFLIYGLSQINMGIRFFIWWDS